MVKRRVHLYGHMAEKFGPYFDLAVKSVAEAIRLLEANFPGKFCNNLRIGSYHVLVGPRELEYAIDEEKVRFKFPDGDFHIIPVPEGAGGGHSKVVKALVTIVVGVALVATAFVGAGVLAGAGLAGFGSAAFGGVSWGSIGLFGAALALSGVSQLLTPTPKNKDNSSSNANNPSYFFSGPTNSVQEGACVPVVYGRVRAGSVVADGGIFDEALDPNYVYRTAGGGDGTGLLAG